MLASLVAASALVQFALSARLALLRRIFTPTVCGTVIMLIAVTVMPIIFDMLSQVPEGAPPASAPVSAAATVIITVAVTLARGRRVAPLGTGHRHRLGLRGRRRLRHLRHPAHRRGGLDRPARGRLARTRLQLRRDLLVPPAGVHLRDPHRGHRDHRRQRRHPTGVVAQGAGRGLPGGAGRGGGGRAREPALGRRGHGAQHDLLDEHRGGRDHRRDLAPRRRVHRRRLHRPSVPAQVHGPDPRDPGSRGLGLHRGAVVDPVRARHEGGGAGRHRLPQGGRGRGRVLDRHGVPAAVDLPRGPSARGGAGCSGTA